MLSRNKILSAMAGLAMLAMPVSALAGHKHDNQDRFRPYASHDQGWHRGWDKHPFAPRVDRNFDHPRIAPYRPGPFAWNHDGDYGPNRAPNYYQRGRWSGYGPNNGCDADGDDCGGINNGGTAYWGNNGGYNQGEPYSWYQAAPPTRYGSTQQLNWLIARRQRAMQVIAQMRARGDSRGAARMASIVQALNRRINRLGGGRYGANTRYPYAPASAYVPPIASLGRVPAYAPTAPSYGANNYYGAAAPYYPNSTLGALASVAGPMLGLP